MEDEAVNDFTLKEIMRSHKEEHDALRVALNEAIRERDAALAEVARMRPVVESAVRWLSDLTEYAELELERTARDYRQGGNR